MSGRAPRLQAPAFVLLALSAAAAAGAGGVSLGNPANPTAPLAIPGGSVELRHLLALPDQSAPVRYAPGSLDRASHAQDWLRELALVAAKRTRHATPLRAVVLPREDWEGLATGVPYGLPLVTTAGIVALPATGDAGTVALWMGEIAALPPIPGTPLLGTVEEAASLVAADFVAAPAAGRVLALAAGFVPEEPWVGDLLGHLLALDAGYQERLGRAEAALAFWQGIRRAPRRPAEGALAAELRRHAALALAAEAILGSERRLPGTKLRRLQDRAGGVLRVADLRGAWPRPLEVLGDAAVTTRP